MSIRTTLIKPKGEKKTTPLGFTITDTDEVTPLQNADSILLTLTMTLYEATSGAIINGCAARDILNANGGTVASTGKGTVRLDVADMACLTTKANELHVALIEWTWGSPLKAGGHEIAFTVTNLLKVI